MKCQMTNFLVAFSKTKVNLSTILEMFLFYCLKEQTGVLVRPPCTALSATEQHVFLSFRKEPAYGTLSFSRTCQPRNRKETLTILLSLYSGAPLFQTFIGPSKKLEIAGSQSEKFEIARFYKFYE